MEKVQILMSTYNGEKYLVEQIESILKQDYTNFSLLIRDDGSTDNTVTIIEKYAKVDCRITYYHGNNIGVINSFFDLLKNADITMDYYSLSDQDDVWKVDKLSRAVEKLKINKAIPTLYCGNVILVNQALQPIVSTIRKAKIIPNFGNALVENINFGCTSVFNSELLDLVKKHIPEFTIMHDWWLYLSASAFGKVIYDEESFILYRQHEDNVIGSKTNYYDEFKNRLKNFKGNRGRVSRQAREFSRLYQIEHDKNVLLLNVINAKRNFLKRFNVFFSKRIYRQRKLDHYIFKILFLFGRV